MLAAHWNGTFANACGVRFYVSSEYQCLSLSLSSLITLQTTNIVKDPFQSRRHGDSPGAFPCVFFAKKKRKTRDIWFFRMDKVVMQRRIIKHIYLFRYHYKLYIATRDATALFILSRTHRDKNIFMAISMGMFYLAPEFWIFGWFFDKNVTRMHSSTGDSRSTLPQSGRRLTQTFKGCTKTKRYHSGSL